MHGIKGGRLRDERGLRWVGARQALGLDRRPLSLPLGWAEQQDRDGLTPDGPIARVLWVSIYGGFLKHAARVARTFVPFSYDWRREIPEAAAHLTTTLERLAAEHGRPARIVAHSMGGLVTLHALRERPDLACGVLFAGTPFGTGIGFTRDTHIGSTTGLNAQSLSVAAANSWSAHWVFFPTGPDAGLRDGAHALDHDWYDPASWERHGLGVFAPGSGFDPALYRAHLTEAMGRAARTRARLQDPAALASAGVPIAILRSGDHDTPTTVVRNGPRAVRGWDVDTVESAPGDGRVRFPATEPPGLSFEAFSTSRGHDALLEDGHQVDAALAWLVARA